MVSVLKESNGRQIANEIEHGKMDSQILGTGTASAAQHLL